MHASDRPEIEGMILAFLNHSNGPTTAGVAAEMRISPEAAAVHLEELESANRVWSQPSHGSAVTWHISLEGHHYLRRGVFSAGGLSMVAWGGELGSFRRFSSSKLSNLAGRWDCVASLARLKLPRIEGFMGRCAQGIGILRTNSFRRSAGWGSVRANMELPTTDAAFQAAIEEIRALRWMCANCGYVATFTEPVSVRSCEACPKCKRTEFRIA